MARRVTAGHEALRQSEHPSPSSDFTHDVVAVDSSGEVLFPTESLYSEEATDAKLEEYNDLGDIPEEVDHYEIHER
jgi:hypothetical protein